MGTKTEKELNFCSSSSTLLKRRRNFYKVRWIEPSTVKEVPNENFFLRE